MKFERYMECQQCLERQGHGCRSQWLISGGRVGLGPTSAGERRKGDSALLVFPVVILLTVTCAQCWVFCSVMR